MSEKQVNHHCYAKRLDCLESVKRLVDEFKIECDTLDKICKGDHSVTDYSKLSDDSLHKIQQDFCVLLSRFNTAGFSIESELLKIGRVKKFRLKPIFDEEKKKTKPIIDKKPKKTTQFTKIS